MSEGHEPTGEDHEAVADWFRREDPGFDRFEIDRVKSRALARASRNPSRKGPSAWLAGALSLSKGALMPARPVFTLLMLFGLVGVVSVTMLGLTGQLPGQGGPGFENAQTTQYASDQQGVASQDNDNDDNDDSSSKDNDDDNAEGLVAPPFGVLGIFARSDCGLFRRQNFTTPRALNRCDTATFRVLSGQFQGLSTAIAPQVTPQTACQGFSKTRPRGQRRSDYAACVLAIQLTQAALRRLFGPSSSGVPPTTTP